MWICSDCENKNADTDAFCPCCGAKRPSAPRPTPPKSPSGSANTVPKAPPPPPVREAEPPSAVNPAPAAPPKKQRLPFVFYIAIAIALFMVWKIISNSASSYKPYTGSSAVNDKVYVDVIRVDPFAYCVFKSDLQPTYVACRCLSPDGKEIYMFATTEEYKQVFDQSFHYSPYENEEHKTLNYQPALRIYGTVYDGEFLFPNNSISFGIKTLVKYESSDGSK